MTIQRPADQWRFGCPTCAWWWRAQRRAVALKRVLRKNLHVNVYECPSCGGYPPLWVFLPPWWERLWRRIT